MPTFSELLTMTQKDDGALLGINLGVPSVTVTAKPPVPEASAQPAAKAVVAVSFAHLNPAAAARMQVHQVLKETPTLTPAEPTADDLARSVVEAMKANRRTIRL